MSTQHGTQSFHTLVIGPSCSCPYAQLELPSGSRGASCPKPRSQEPKPRSINEAAPFTKSEGGVNRLSESSKDVKQQGVGEPCATNMK